MLKEELQNSHLFFPFVIVSHKGVDYLLQFVWMNKGLCVLLNPFWH